MTPPRVRRQWSPERERAREAERLKAMEREERRRRQGRLPARKTKGVQTWAQEESEEGAARAHVASDAGVEVEVWVPECVRRATAAAAATTLTTSYAKSRTHFTEHISQIIHITLLGLSIALSQTHRIRGVATSRTNLTADIISGRARLSILNYFYLKIRHFTLYIYTYKFTSHTSWLSSRDPLHSH